MVESSISEQRKSISYKSILIKRFYKNSKPTMIVLYPGFGFFYKSDYCTSITKYPEPGI